MAKTPKDYERELSLVLNAIAESVAEAPAETILIECQEAGMDIETTTNETRQVLEKALKRFRQRNLYEAKKQHEARVISLQKQRYELPESIERLRELLASLFILKPQFRGHLTAQYRDLQELSDNDVRRILQQLNELGALDDLSKRDGHQ